MRIAVTGATGFIGRPFVEEALRQGHSVLAINRSGTLADGDKAITRKPAVWSYLKDHPEFEIDRDIDKRLCISTVPEGYLRRVR